MKSVLVSYLHNNMVHHNMMDSLWNLREYDRDHENLLYARFPVAAGPGGIDTSRNEVARVLLEQTECEWLWFVDYDMGFRPDTLARLVEAADPEDRPVVAGLYHNVFLGETDGRGGWITEISPLAYIWGKPEIGDEGFLQIPDEDIPPNVVVEVAGAGTGCMLIHRSVLEGLGSDWFTYMNYANGNRISEDLSFCYRVKTQLQKPIFLHTGLELTHHKATWIGQ